MTISFLSQLEKSIKKNNSLLCIGLDPDMSKFPDHIKNRKNPLFQFNKMIIDSTQDLVCSFKPNIAYYAAYGTQGLTELKQTIDYIHDRYPHIPVILDAKRGDIASTSVAYAKEAFEFYNANAVTINPYLGFDSVEPFLTYSKKGIIVLCRTSNPGATVFQDLSITKKPLYIRVAEEVQHWHRSYKNCLLVVGATWPKQLKEIRKIAPDMFYLIPGIGSQGGDLKKTLLAGLRNDRSGLIISASRSIIYAGSKEHIRQEAELLRDTINQHR